HTLGDSIRPAWSFSGLITRPTLNSSLFPYTTLFRSYGFGFTALLMYMIMVADGPYKTAHYAICTGLMALGMMVPGMFSGRIQERSEEHTSELQSRENLVCRLLLEKKNSWMSASYSF